MRRYMVELSIIGRLVMTGWGGGGDNVLGSPSCLVK